jgi:hypothetical protein
VKWFVDVNSEFTNSITHQYESVGIKCNMRDKILCWSINNMYVTPFRAASCQRIVGIEVFGISS